MNALVNFSAAALLVASSASAVAATPAATRPAPSSVSAASRAALPWIEDDYARAIAEGKRRGLPVFVEAWAPW